jgi:hypothetical protein
MKSLQTGPETKHLASSFYRDTTIGVNPVPATPKRFFPMATARKRLWAGVDGT